MTEHRFQVQGSAPLPYLVTFVYDGEGSLSGFCTCPAGKNGQYCKHRLAILNGETKAVVSDNQHEVPMVVSWLSGSNLEAALREFAAAERDMDHARRTLSKAKKHLAEVMRG